MYMSDEEILRSYKEAKDPKEQCKILADLNVCKVEDIVECLKKQGIDGRKLPQVNRKPKGVKSASTDSQTVVKKRKRSQSNENSSSLDIFKYIQELKDRRKALLAEVGEIESTIQKISDMCNVLEDN